MSWRAPNHARVAQAGVHAGEKQDSFLCQSFCCKTKRWETVAFTACVFLTFGGGGVSVSKSKTMTKTAAVVRDVNRKTKYNGKDKIITKPPVTPPQQCYLMNEQRWALTKQTAHVQGPTGRCDIFNRCLIPLVHNHNNRNVPDRSLHFIKKKMTALCSMPSLNSQAPFLSVNLFSSQRQSASTQDNNSGTETFY